MESQWKAMEMESQVFLHITICCACSLSSCPAVPRVRDLGRAAAGLRSRRACRISRRGLGAFLLLFVLHAFFLLHFLRSKCECVFCEFYDKELALSRSCPLFSAF